MYGLLLQSVQHFVQKDYGEAIWQRVLCTAQVQATEFNTHTRYDAAIMVNLAHACESVIGGGKSSQDYMCYFGRCFVGYFTHYGYDRILRVAGRHFRDFLRGIDNIHETMRFSYPKMLSPSFYVAQEDEKGCVLHYRSKRRGFTQYVAGQIQECAKDFYGIDVEICVLNEEFHVHGCHITYRLNFNNAAFKSQQCQKYQSPSPYSDISGAFFMKIFPFSLVFNRSLLITYNGPAITRLFPDRPVVGANMQDVFTLRRPLMKFTWEDIICMKHLVQFELQSLYKAKNQASDTERSVLLKGEMRYMSDFNGIVFLCSLLISNVDELESLGLYINDLNMYDSSREMVVAGCQHASRLEYSIEKQVARSLEIEENLKRLDEEQQRSEKLLYSMIPKSTALRLKNGEDPVSTCEVFESVSILFSYLVGFTDLCHHLPAISLLQCINSVFKNFDDVIDKYDVFKVETLGDAVYMVAGGVPERRPGHAQQVACVAMELLQKIDNVLVPQEATLPKLQIRVGIHTGSVVGGVVGRRMPQYCLFGDTVNTASRMQSYGQSGRIHISETTNGCLEGTGLQTAYRGKIHIKGKGEMKTYWLLNKEVEEVETCPVPLQDATLSSTGLIHSHRSVDEYCFRKTDTVEVSDAYQTDRRKTTVSPDVSEKERSCDQSVLDCVTSCVRNKTHCDKNDPEKSTEEGIENTQLDRLMPEEDPGDFPLNKESYSPTEKTPDVIHEMPENQNHLSDEVIRKSKSAASIRMARQADKNIRTRRSSFSGILQCPFRLFASDDYRWDKFQTTPSTNPENNERVNFEEIAINGDVSMHQTDNNWRKVSQEIIKNAATEVQMSRSLNGVKHKSTQTPLSLINLQENTTLCPTCGRNGIIKKEK